MAYLLTNHDPYHVHAIIGLMALIHWIYRVYLLVLDVPHGGFGINATQDICCLLLEIAPNVTSFLFRHVPVKKGTADGFTIWKEYRLHAFIFVFKLWFLQCLYVYAQHTQPLQYEVYYRAGATFAAMYAAGYATNLYPKQTSTIRGMYKSSWAVFLAGMIQFLARAVILYGPPDPNDRIAISIVGCFLMQLNAFNMTLRKKRITGPKTTQAFYSSMLIGATYIILGRRLWHKPPLSPVEPRMKFLYLAFVAYYLRRSGFDKYASWILALSVMAIVSQQFGLFGDQLTGTVGNGKDLLQNFTAEL